MGRRYQPGQVKSTGPILTGTAPGSMREKAPVGSADMFGGRQASQLVSFGESLSQTGDNIGKLGNVLSQPDKITAANAFREASRELRESAYSLLSEEGPDSATIGERYEAKIREIQDKYHNDYLDGSNDATVSTFNASFDAMAGSHAEMVYRKQLQNKDRETKIALEGLNNDSIENAVMYKGDPAWTELSELEIEANTRSIMKGKGKTEVDQAVQNNITKLHTSVLDSIASVSPSKALEYLTVNETKFNPLTVSKLREELNKAAVEEQAIAAGSALSSSGMSIEKQLVAVDEQYKKHGNEALYKATKSEVMGRFKVKEDLKDKRAEDNFNAEVYKTLSDKTYRPKYNPLFSASQNATIKNLFENKLSGAKQADDIPLYAKIVSGELTPTPAEFASKYAGHFKSSTAKGLLDFIVDRDEKDNNAMRVMTSYQQAQQNIKKNSDFDIEKDEGRALTTQFYTEYQRRLELIPVEKRSDYGERQKIINDLLAPAYDPSSIDWWGGNLYRFQLPYTGKEYVKKGFENVKNIPNVLKERHGANNLIYDENDNIYYVDEGDIRIVYDSLTGKELARRKRKRGK